MQVFLRLFHLVQYLRLLAFVQVFLYLLALD
jgi:hypothetical protein